jgi:thiol-disulfide isomerase/thioredoxin
VEAEVGMPAPEISGQSWLNSEPLRLAELLDKVVLVEFWTFGCYNCRNVEPYLKEWHQKYADKVLAVIGVHAPEVIMSACSTICRDTSASMRFHIRLPSIMTLPFGSAMAIATGALCI